MTAGVMLYGPPAAGKDTVTAALTSLEPKFRQFRRLKVGTGRTLGYRMTSQREVELARDAGDLIWENKRYDSTYYVDRRFLEQELNGAVPVLHLGQAAAISAIKSAFPRTDWLVVHLWCPRDVAESRIMARGTGDESERLAAWDATELISADLSINTAVVQPIQAAMMIRNGFAADSLKIDR